MARLTRPTTWVEGAAMAFLAGPATLRAAERTGATANAAREALRASREIALPAEADREAAILEEEVDAGGPNTKTVCVGAV